MAIKTLDLTAAEYAQKMVKEQSSEKEDAEILERVVTKALGVLQEQGVYACLLFLFSRPESERRYAETIHQKLIDLLNSEPVKPLAVAFPANKDKKRWQDVSDHLTKDNGLMESLDKLFLVKDLYEQTLIYARFGAKAAAS